eukprot:5852241-Prymnesium_polylepis.2
MVHPSAVRKSVWVAVGSGSSSLSVSLMLRLSQWACAVSLTAPLHSIVHSVPRGGLSSPSVTSARNSSATSPSHLRAYATISFGVSPPCCTIASVLQQRSARTVSSAQSGSLRGFAGFFFSSSALTSADLAAAAASAALISAAAAAAVARSSSVLGAAVAAAARSSSVFGAAVVAAARSSSVFGATVAAVMRSSS